MNFFVFFLNKYFLGLIFYFIHLTEWLIFDPLKGFNNITTLSAFDRLSYWTDKIVLHITFPFYQHYFEIIERGLSYMIPG